MKAKWSYARTRARPCPEGVHTNAPSHEPGILAVNWLPISTTERALGAGSELLQCRGNRGRRCIAWEGMEPFTYDDYSDFDADELDFDPPLRRSTTSATRRPARPLSPFELGVDEGEMEKIRSRARQATADFLDSCDAMRQKAKIKDQDALNKFNAAMDLPPSAPRRASISSSRRSSLGLIPTASRSLREGSHGSDLVVTSHASSVRSGPAGARPPPPPTMSTREGSRGSEVDADSSATPPVGPGLRSLRVRHRSPGLPPPTPNVMDEINALEAFARDTRPLHEKLPRGPVVRSRFVRSMTPGAKFLTSPRMSPARSGSLAPRMTTETVVSTDADPRERISTRRKIRDVESRLDKILDYELPYASGFKEMRNALRDINDKMARHRLMIDRYSGLQMNEDNEPVADRVAAKVDELIPRVPALSGVQNPFKPRTYEVTGEFDPRLIPGYVTGICVTQNEGTQELRGRIRNLLCRTRETSRKDAANPHLKAFPTKQRTAAVAE
uniref:Enkurin domain-containing protein n=1 Tax=Mesocestoides corti TaxID=53468 RepID=A0A5K3FDA4_MESCO